MAFTRLGFESGANGDPASPTNTGFDSIVNSGGTFTISTAWAQVGTRSVKGVATSASGGVYGQKTIPATTALYVEGWLNLTGSPSAEVPLIVYATGATRQVSVALTTARELRMRDAAAAGGANQFTTSAVPLAPVKVCFFATQNATTGTFRLAWSGTAPYSTFDSDSTTLTGKNTGAAAYDTIRVGAKATASSITLDSAPWDQFGWEPDGTGFPVTPPTMSTMQTLTAYQFLNLTGTTVAVGPVAYTASPSTGVVATATGLFLPAPATGTTTYTVTATDTGNGATTTISKDVTAALGGGVKTRVWSGTTWADFPNNALFPDSNLYPDTGRILGA